MATSRTARLAQRSRFGGLETGNAIENLEAIAVAFATEKYCFYKKKTKLHLLKLNFT